MYHSIKKINDKQMQTVVNGQIKISLYSPMI